MTTKKKKPARKPAKRKTRTAAAKEPAATPTRRRRMTSELPAGAVKRWGLRLAPEAAAAVDAEADRQVSSGSAVIAEVVTLWAASRREGARSVLVEKPGVSEERTHLGADARPARREETLEEFAHRTLATARRLRTGEWTTPKKRGVRFGDDKVFIRPVYEEMQRYGGIRDTWGLRYTWEEFRERLLEASRARLLDLSRADLVEAMHPEDVAESHVKYLSSDFNFITLRDR